MKKVLTLLFASLLYCEYNAQVSLSWSAFTDSTVSLSSPRAADLNGDGIKDIIIGAGKEAQPTNFGILAFDGATGASLWTRPAENEVFTSAAFSDISGDNIPDIFLGGRDAQLYAINGSNGNLIWEFFPYPNANPVDSGLYNFYSVQLLPDMNADNVPDLLVANGGDHAAPVWQTNRPPGHLMVIDAVTGDVLAKAVMPDSGETYCSPVVTDLKGNGTLYIIYGTGGETLGGSMWVAELNDLMNNDLSPSVALVTHATRGFIAPASIGNFSNDGNLDIIVQGYAGTIYRFYGGNYSLKWSTTIPGSESSAAPVLGNFTGTITPDVFCVLYKGSAPSYSDFYQVMLDGANGTLIFKDSISNMHFASANAFDSNGDGRDEALISVNENSGYFKHQLKVIDFQNDTVTDLWSAEAGTNIGSTPLIADLDNDNKLDVVYAYRKDSLNPMGWKGLYVKRLGTNVDIPIAGIAWGGYMGSYGDGHYTYTVTDCGNGSILSGSMNNNPTCNGASDGSIVPYTANGTAPFTYLWSDGSVGSSLTNIAAGTYTLTVTDSTGCSETASATVNDPFVISFGGIMHNTCPGGSNGQATVSSSGCVCMFSGCTFLWSTGTTGYTATALSAGTYTVTITHAGGCVVNATVAINDGAPVISGSNIDNVSCAGAMDGGITLTSTNMGANYDWSNGDSTSSINNLAPGTYTVNVSDNRPCYDTLTYTITEPPALTLSVSATPETFTGSADGTASASVSGGVGSYSYLWDDLAAQTTSTAVNLSTGMYAVVVTDSNGCAITDSVLVDITTLINEAENKISVFAYPNPSAENVIVHFTGEYSACNAALFDINGRLLRTYGTLRAQQLIISKAELSAGNYFLKVSSGNRTAAIRIVFK